MIRFASGRHGCCPTAAAARTTAGRNQTVPGAASARLARRTPRSAPGTVAAPPGTKEGDTRVLSVTDRRLDELQRNSKSAAAQRMAPQREAARPGDDFDGWRPVAANGQRNSDR